MKRVKVAVLIALAMSGCSETKELAETVEYARKAHNKTDFVRENAAKAIEECGKGNVKSVNAEGFTCSE